MTVFFQNLQSDESREIDAKYIERHLFKKRLFPKF